MRNSHYLCFMAGKEFFDVTFDKVDFTKELFEIGEYEGCTFNNCNLMDVDLGETKLIDCKFSACNITTAKVSQVSFQDVHFVHCKMVGLQFKNSNDFLFSVSFDTCNLQLASFYKLLLKKMKFNNCILREVDFTLADLSQSSFEGCDLAGAVFSDTNLEKADFSKAYYNMIDPDRNRMKKATFSIDGAAGLLGKYDILFKDTD